MTPLPDQLRAHTAIYDGIAPEEAKVLYRGLKLLGFKDRKVSSINKKALVEAHLVGTNIYNDEIEIDIIAAELFGFFVDLRVSVKGKIV